jgi:hypothetical protein
MVLQPASAPHLSSGGLPGCIWLVSQRHYHLLLVLLGAGGRRCCGCAATFMSCCWTSCRRCATWPPPWTSWPWARGLGALQAPLPAPPAW